MKRDKLNLIFAVIILIFILFILFFVINKNVEKDVDRTDYIYCKSEDVSVTSYCLVNYVKTFYRFTDSDDTIKSLETIKKEGGDCFDYSHLYKGLAKELGFSARTISIEKTEDVGHMFVIIYDSGGYCVIDLIQEPACFKYG